jgi:hypothetical protein
MCESISVLARSSLKEAAMPQHQFYAHASAEEAGRGHLVREASSFEDAAIRFAEDRYDAAEAGELKVIVRDADTGEQHCFCVDVGEGEVEPC